MKGKECSSTGEGTLFVKQGEAWQWELKRIFQESTVSSQFLTWNSIIPNTVRSPEMIG